LRFRSERSNGNFENNGEEIYRLVDIGLGQELVGHGKESVGALQEELQGASERNTSPNA